MTDELTAAKQAILDYLEAGKFLRRRVKVGNKEVEFRSAAEAVAALREVEALLASEAGTTVLRTYAQNAGRGLQEEDDEEEL